MDLEPDYKADLGSGRVPAMTIRNASQSRDVTRKHIVAFSGGKDSTALALKMAEEYPDMKFELLFTPTGNELPEVREHINSIAHRIGRAVVVPDGGKSLKFWIEQYNALPNFRMRWCTRQIKIVPCIAYLRKHPQATLYVGLRADEEERRGLYGEHAVCRFPLREWGMGLTDVVQYLRANNVVVPRRTDCALCYHQRLGEWHALWKNHPELFKEGVAMERQTGHTFRSPGRDTWPLSLNELGSEFERGRIPRGGDTGQGTLFGEENVDQCRICRL